MFNLALMVLPLGIAVSVYSYLKNHISPSILYWATYTVGLYQWMVRTEASYPLRLVYPLLTSLLPVSTVTSMWFWNFIFWWAGSMLFYHFLKTIIGSQEALLGALIPLVNYSTMIYGFWHVDGLNWIIVVGCFYCAYRYLDNKQYRYVAVKTHRYLLFLAGFVALGILNDYPIPSARGILPLYDGVFVLATFAWQIPFIIKGAQHPRPRYLRWSLYFIPIYLAVFAITTDWCRWIVLAAPITVPLVLRGIREYGRTER